MILFICLFTRFFFLLRLFQCFFSDRQPINECDDFPFDPTFDLKNETQNNTIKFKSQIVCFSQMMKIDDKFAATYTTLADEWEHGFCVAEQSPWRMLKAAIAEWPSGNDDSHLRTLLPALLLIRPPSASTSHPIFVTSLPCQCHWLTNPVMIKSNRHENDAVMWPVNCAWNQELSPQYNCWYPSVNCCDDGEDDFVCCSMRGSTGFVTITMDHNAEFRYLNHPPFRNFHSCHCDRCCWCAGCSW